MTCRLKDPNLVPPGDFAYRQPETGVVRNGRALSATIKLVVEHRQANGLPRQTPEEVDEDVQRQICTRLPAEFCHGDCSAVTPGRINREQILGAIHALALTAATALAGDSPFVDQAEAERRAAICSRCFMNDRSNYRCNGCSFTAKLREAMGLTIGDRATSRDAALEVCAVCGCLNRVTVWFKGNILRATMSDRERQKYQTIPACWKANLLPD